jgi:hypothetical protein
MARELKVIQEYYDLSVYLSGRILRFPRNIRYGLGLAMEKRLQYVLGLLVRAKYSPVGSKEAILGDTNIELEILRFQLRQAADLKALALSSQRHALERLQNIGQQVGAWLRSLRPATGTSSSPGL